ncbi:DMT family transporter [Alphaproteobacteria bacterium LSUCC0684]
MSSSLLRAIIAILVGIAALDSMGVIVRMLGGDYPILMVSVMRNFFGLIPVIAILMMGPGLGEIRKIFKARHLLILALRGASVLMAQMSFYTALTKIEFATASALGFTSPFFISALSIPILGHRVGWVRFAAIVVGFAGVLTILKPFDEAFTIWMLLPVLAALGYGLSNVLVRLFPDDVPSAAIQTGQQWASFCFGLVLLFTISEPVPIASSTDAMLFILLGCFGGIGVMGLVVAYRLVEPSILAPFEYFGIPISFLLGWMFFDEAPFATLFPGVLFIVGAGLIIIVRERRAQNRKASVDLPIKVKG